MPALRALLTEGGFADVRTYVASGNVVLSSSDSPASVATEVERLIAERFGFDVDVIVRTRDELAEVVARNPLADEAVDPKRYQVTFLEEEIAPQALERLDLVSLEPERLVSVGRELYTWHPDGIGRSKLWGSWPPGWVGHEWNRAQLEHGDDAAGDGRRDVGPPGPRGGLVWSDELVRFATR